MNTAGRPCGGIGHDLARVSAMTMRKLQDIVLHGMIGALALLALSGSLAAAGTEEPAEIQTAQLAIDPELPRFEPTVDAAPIAESEPVAMQPVGSGMASWYGTQFAGRRTASGERFDPAGYTAAHRTLPFGSRVRVTHESSGRSVIVRINDRGPFSHGRIIDVSQGAARELGLVAAGSGRVRLELITG